MSYRVPVENGKYVIVVQDGDVRVERGELTHWLHNPPGSKMLIAVAAELERLRTIEAAAKKLVLLVSMLPQEGK